MPVNLALMRPNVVVTARTLHDQATAVARPATVLAKCYDRFSAARQILIRASVDCVVTCYGRA